MYNNIDEIHEWLHDLKNAPDPRFWVRNKMDIFDVFNWLNTSGYLDDEEILYKLVNYIKDNRLIK